ncbi:hypothetical protein [Rhizobium leguminosarum]
MLFRIAICCGLALGLSEHAQAAGKESDYKIYKQVTRDLYAAGLYIPPEREETVGLLECPAIDILDMRDQTTNDARRILARDIVHSELALKAAGYPKELYEKAIAALETKALSGIATHPNYMFDRERSDFEAAASQINKMRKRSTLKLAKVEAGAECDTELNDIPLKLPKGARLWQISEFEFRVCQTKATDPWDMSGCRGWTEARGKVAGGAVSEYQIIWADGTKQKSSAPVDLANGGDDGTFAPVKAPAL